MKQIQNLLLSVVMSLAVMGASLLGTVLLGTVLLGTASLCMAQQPAAGASEPVIYSAGTVYTMTGPPLSPGEVLVADGKIQQVAPSIAGGSNVNRIDLGPQSVLVPGFVNAYSQTGLINNQANEITLEITPRFNAKDAVDWNSAGMKEQLATGTTTVCLAPGTENVISGIACTVKTAGDRKKRMVDESGPLVASLCSDPTGRNQARQRPDGIYVRQPTNRMGVVWLLRSNFDKASAGNEVSLQPVNEALNEQRSIFVVSRTAYDLHTVETLADEFGFSPIIVGGQESHQMADSLAKRKIPVVLAALTSGSMRGPEDTELCWNQAGVLSTAGVTICLSGDDLLKQARFAHRYGLSKQEALAAITASPAKLLGIDRRVGTLSPGMDADMIAINGDVFEFTSPILWVMVDGEITELNED